MFKKGDIVRSRTTEGLTIKVTDDQREKRIFAGEILEEGEFRARKKGYFSVGWKASVFELVEIKEVRSKNV